MSDLTYLKMNHRDTHEKQSSLGVISYLIVFLWSLILIILTPPEHTWLAAIVCLIVCLLIYSQRSIYLAIRRLLSPRWLLLTALIVIPSVVFMGRGNTSATSTPFAREGLLFGLRVILQIVVIFVAVSGLTSAVDITSLAGLIERLGLRGLGFSLGIALNLLPALQQSSLNAWRTFWMRGGLRRQRVRGLKLLAMTIITNALRWAEEVSLAAEARAFSPELSREMPIKFGRYDRVIFLCALLSFFGLIVWRYF